jgi:prepilin-type N-terminal cleavage/methylation domain-containing protein/prepilin-type processing-associated H-X9-DG protein
MRMPGSSQEVSREFPRRAGVRGARGFTLIELLVVVGIIALLIAILIPSLSAARRRAQLVTCQANVRSMGQATLLYAEENGGWIPREYSAGDHTRPFWGYLLATEIKLPMPAAFSADNVMIPYFNRLGLFQCPAFGNPKQTVDYVFTGWDVNVPGGGAGGPIRLTVLAPPQQLILLTEANANLQTDTYEYHDVWDPSHLPLGSGPRICNDRRHDGRVNNLFADGRVEARMYTDLKVTDFRIGP